MLLAPGGRTQREIADRLGISETMVARHLDKAAAKFGAVSRIGLCVFFDRMLQRG